MDWKNLNKVTELSAHCQPQESLEIDNNNYFCARFSARMDIHGFMEVLLKYYVYVVYVVLCVLCEFVDSFNKPAIHK